MEMLDSQVKSNPRERCHGPHCSSLYRRITLHGPGRIFFEGKGFLKLNLTCADRLVQFSDEFDIAPDSVQLAMVNHRVSTKDRNYQTWRQNSAFAGDYPMFADWIELRMRGVKCPTDQSSE